MSVSDITSILALLLALSSGAVSAAMYHFKVRVKIAVMDTHVHELRNFVHKVEEHDYNSNVAVLKEQFNHLQDDVKDIKSDVKGIREFLYARS